MTVTDLPRPTTPLPQSQDPRSVEEALNDPACAGWAKELAESREKLLAKTGAALLES